MKFSSKFYLIEQRLTIIFIKRVLITLFISEIELFIHGNQTVNVYKFLLVKHFSHL